MPAEYDVLLRPAQGFAACYPDLLLHQVNACHQFADRMLDLDTRIHLQKIELLPVLVVDELDRACVLVPDGSRQRYPGLANFFAQSFADCRCRGFFHQFLVTALQGAVALSGMDYVTERVAQHLYLDMARVGDVAFDVQAVVAKRGARLVAGGIEHLLELLGLRDNFHAAPATAGRRFENYRKADTLRHLRRLLRRVHLLRARQQRQAEGLGSFASLDLVAHGADMVGLGTDEN